MEDFPPLHSYRRFTKVVTKGRSVVALVGFRGDWRFLFGRDERTGRPE